MKPEGSVATVVSGPVFAEGYNRWRVRYKGDTVDRWSAEDYLDACGSKFAGRVPAAAFQRLSESIDLHDVDAGEVRVPTTVVAVAEDRLVPIEDAYRLVERLRCAKRLRVLRSRYGHDAFLKEHDDVSRVLREALDDAAGAAA